LDLRETSDSHHLVIFESPDEVEAASTACREAIVHISRNSFKHNEYHGHAADYTFIPLAELAIGATVADRSMRTDSVNLYILKLALKTFGDPGHTKQAVNELTTAHGYFSNRAIEKRVYLGHVANQMIESIDPVFAAESLEQSRQRYAELVIKDEGRVV